MRRPPVLYRETQRAQVEARAIIEAAQAEARQMREAVAREAAASKAREAEARRAMEARLVDVVVAAVRALLEAELASSPELVRSFVRRALRLAADPEASVHLHPDEVHHHPGAGADPRVGRGCCRVETRGAQIRCSAQSASEGLRSLWVGP